MHSTRGEIRDPANAPERTRACEAYVPLIESLCSKKDNLQISNRSGYLKFKWSSPLEGGDVMYKLKGYEPMYVSEVLHRLLSNPAYYNRPAL